ncbi:hypothetical protein QTP86_009824, partial [Hemibagrus guttatus]
DLVLPEGAVVLQYADDLLISAETADICKEATWSLLNRLAQRGFKVSLSKLLFCETEVKYLGFILTQVLASIRMTPNSTGYSPHELTFGRPFPNPWRKNQSVIAGTELDVHMDEYASALVDTLSRLQQQVVFPTSTATTTLKPRNDTEALKEDEKGDRSGAGNDETVQTNKTQRRLLQKKRNSVVHYTCYSQAPSVLSSQCDHFFFPDLPDPS